MQIMFMKQFVSRRSPPTRRFFFRRARFFFHRELILLFFFFVSFLMHQLYRSLESQLNAMSFSVCILEDSGLKNGIKNVLFFCYFFSFGC